MGPHDAILSALAAAWVAGWILLAILARHRLPAAAAAAAMPTPAPLSVIVPARDEARNLPRLLDSLALDATLVGEIIVVDDASTDGTPEVAARHGARVLPAGPLPEGWRGKSWACWQGARQATGARLLFLDADLWWEPGGLRRLLAAHRGGAVSVGPWHAVGRPVEHLSALFNLLMAAGTVPHGLFGQVLLVEREDYFRVGGHQAVKGCTLENFRLAEKFRAAGIAPRSWTGRGAVSFRMYPGGLREMTEGWTKGFAAGARHTPAPVLALVSAWLGGLCLGAATAAWLPWGPPAFLLLGIQAWCLLRQAGGFAWWTGLLYPLPLLFYLGLFARSWWRAGKGVTWKGRTLDAG